MAAKAFIVCASALFVQYAMSECAGRIGPCRSGLPAEDGLAYGWPKRAGCGGLAPAFDISIASSLNAAYGRGFSVSSASALPPTGLAVESENAYEGCVAVAGNLPYLGTAEVEGVFPTAGAGVINYGCGDGAVAITAEAPIEAAFAPTALTPAAMTPALSSLGYNGIPARECGCESAYIY